MNSAVRWVYDNLGVSRSRIDELEDQAPTPGAFAQLQLCVAGKASNASPGEKEALRILLAHQVPRLMEREQKSREAKFEDNGEVLSLLEKFGNEAVQRS